MSADGLIPGMILIVVSVLIMLGAALNWRIVSRPGKLFNMVLGDKAARVVYFGVGVFLFVKGIEILIGANWF